VIIDQEIGYDQESRNAFVLHHAECVIEFFRLSYRHDAKPQAERSSREFGLRQEASRRRIPGIGEHRHG
jgi:hypothetical protein